METCCHTDRQEEKESCVTWYEFFPDVSASRILAVSLENCLLPRKPIGLLITLEWIGPVQKGGEGISGTPDPFCFLSHNHHIVNLVNQ